MTFPSFGVRFVNVSRGKPNERVYTKRQFPTEKHKKNQTIFKPRDSAIYTVYLLKITNVVAL